MTTTPFSFASYTVCFRIIHTRPIIFIYNFLVLCTIFFSFNCNWTKNINITKNIWNNTSKNLLNIRNSSMMLVCARFWTSLRWTFFKWYKGICFERERKPQRNCKNATCSASKVRLCRSPYQRYKFTNVLFL